jgi:hypothetical protein
VGVLNYCKIENGGKVSKGSRNLVRIFIKIRFILTSNSSQIFEKQEIFDPGKKR